MRNIRKLKKEEYKAYAEIARNAYPAFDMKTDDMVEYFEKTASDNPTIDFYGYFEDENLLGGMRLHDFVMNFQGKELKAGGVGFVAVDLLHKKRKVCKDMIIYYLQYTKESGAPLAVLYPFRPDFYKKMGFGYGVQMHKYIISPLAFSKGNKDNLHFLTEDDLDEFLNCYGRYYEKTHGMFAKGKHDYQRLFKNPNIRVIGYKKDGKILGYMIFSFKKAHENNFVINDMEINEIVFENREVFKEFSAFLNSQYDQIRKIIYYTQDGEFYHSLLDVRGESGNMIPSVYHETNTSGMGLMYRIVDFKKLISDLVEYNFNDVTGKVKFEIVDSFFPENEGDYIVSFEDGKAEIPEFGEYDYSIKCDVSILSSILVGAMNIEKAYRYGLIEIDNEKNLPFYEKLFYIKEKPVCLTAF